MRLIALILLAFPALAQAPPQFDVASVKVQPWTGQGGVGVFVRNDTLDAEHCSLYALIAFAYDLRDMQLSGGPAWADRSQLKLDEAELYQVLGKVASDPPPPTAVFRQMLQTLLADRFQLKVHHIQKEFPTYNLVVDKGGLKMKASAGDTKFSSNMKSTGKTGIRLAAAQMTMEKFVAMLAPPSGRPVFDETGLDGGYEFTLEFVFENAPVGPDASSDFPPISIALRNQLGLRLEPATAPFDTVVIDHAERPTGN